MTLLEKVKVALRINHDYLNTDINDTIATARQEMIRAGVDSEVANGDSDLVVMAIKTYCLFVYATEKAKEGFWNSWEYQLDCIRKSNLGE